MLKQDRYIHNNMKKYYILAVVAFLAGMTTAQVPTKSVQIAAGTTAQRPASPKPGETRWNIDSIALETWSGSAWLQAGSGGGLSDGDKGDVTVSGSGAVWNVDSGVIGPTEIASTAVTPGSYTLTSLTVDADGRITSASSGSETDGSVTNEGSLTVGAGTSTTSLIQSNTSGSTSVTLEAGTNITLSEAGSTITIAASSGGGSPSVITPAQITAEQNNYAPTGWADATVVRLSCDADMDAIQGFSAETAGEIKTLQNVGSYPIQISPEHASSTAANRIAYSCEIILPPGESMQMMYDGTLSRWVPLAYNSAWWESPTANSVIYDMPVAKLPTAASADTEMDIFGSITLTQATPSATAVPFAAWDMNSGATASGGAGMFYPHEMEELYYTGGAYVFTRAIVYSPSAVSDGTNNYYFFLRIADSPSSGFWDQANSFGLRYDSDVNGGDWQAYSRSSGGTDSVVDTNVPFAANTKYDLFVSMNKAWTEATYYINGVVVARITTNLPTADNLGASTQLEKQAGTSARSMRLWRFVTGGIMP